MNFTKGKFYEFATPDGSGVVVLCTEDEIKAKNTFAGYVIRPKKGSLLSVGDFSEQWNTEGQWHEVKITIEPSYHGVG